ncbi:MAG: type VI secretion system tip protein VgrG [Tepidisphaera sp.]
MPRTQANRFVAIKTALDADVLLIRSMSVTEELGKPFEITAELLSEDRQIDFNLVIAKPCAIRMELGNGQTRYFHGIVAEFSQGGLVGELASYRAVIVPWTWLLTKTSHCRTFQEIKRPDVVQNVLKEQGSDIELRLSETYEKSEFIVQYRETNHNFVSRLLEHEGISYFFTHTDTKHTIVLADSPAAYEPFEGYEKIRFSSEGFDRADEQQGIRTLSIKQVVTPARVTLKDFDPLVPKKDLTKRREKGWDQTAVGEIFDFPGEYTVASEGEAVAQRRLQELQTARHVISGTGNARGIAVGHTFEIEAPPREDLAGKKWLVTNASYEIIVDDYGAAKGGSGGASFSVSFSAIESSVPFRPERVTPSPIISGPQTAIVVGRNGEEITTDEHGRVKVLFHWDRFASGDENSSCWVRVSQAWAGKSWGAMFLPRHGHEVIVEFIEGDPDRPIITGRVYNGDNAPPWELPAKKEISGFFSNSSKGGEGANKILIDDTKGAERLGLRAEKDMMIQVLNNRHAGIAEYDDLTAKNVRWLIKDTLQFEINKDEVRLIHGECGFAIDKDYKGWVDGKQSMTVKGDVAIKSEKNHAIEVAEQFHVKAKEIILEASANLTIKVGSTTIAIEPGGVAIDAKGDVTVKTSGNCKVEATQNVEVKGTAAFKAEGAEASVKGTGKASLEASGQTVVKGGMVMIN